MDPRDPDIEELSSDDLVEEVELERASILNAARGAQNIAMLTGTFAVVSLPLVRPRARLPRAAEIAEGAEGEDEIARLRAFARPRVDDPVGELRARLELAYAELARGDVAAAKAEAERASALVPTSPAPHALLRSLVLGRETVDEQLAHVKVLVESAADDATRADWLCESARLLEAAGRADEALGAWQAALALASDHVGALYGAEVAFERAERWPELAAILERLARLASSRPVAAWLHVERALVLDRRQGDVTGARTALDQALELAPGMGPVRQACVDHAVRHRDDARLAELLEQEAALETDRARAARLELDAALASARAGLDPKNLLERAHGRAPTAPLVDGRVAEELARRYDAEARFADAHRVRKAALAWHDDPREELVALRSLAAGADVGNAVQALERARVIDPDDPALLEDLDTLLARADRHDARAVLWMRESARVEDALAKARALLRSAAAAEAAGKSAEARRAREAAWLTAPNASGVFDEVAADLVPVAQSPAVRARIALYEQALETTRDPDRKVHLLEKIAWLEDDVAGDTAAAVRAYEAILALDPNRLSAAHGLFSAATRARDGRALARALRARADITGDPAERGDLRLQAAEALAPIEPERALALAEEAALDPVLRARALALVTRLHLAAERWDRAAATLAARAAESPDRTALTLAEASILRDRLRSPERALEALARLDASDPAVRAATVASLEALGDDERLAEGLARLEATGLARLRLVVRQAELEEKAGRHASAIATYEKAAGEPLVDERLRRIGEATDALTRAARAIETPAAGSAEPLLASGARDVATLRLAERLARRSGSAPQLANALALMTEAGIFPQRGFEGLASLVAWTLPPGGDDEAWEHLLALGTTDVATLDTLVARLRSRGVDPRVAAAIERRRGSDETERFVRELQLARLRTGADAAKSARAALAIDPGSLSAACRLAELAAELGDDDAAVLASSSLADIVVPKARGAFLRDAADLSKDPARAAELLERALRADPESVETATRLAELQRKRGAFVELARVLRHVLAEATTTEAIVPVASELADVAKNHLGDPRGAIHALERVREVSPRHVPSLFLLAELFIGQRAWDRALEALAGAAEATAERAEKLVALVGRASIYRRVLSSPADAERELRAALQIDPHDPRAIRGLLELGTVAPDERAAMLGRLVIGETGPAERQRALLELAEARRTTGDLAGAEGALVEAASLSPDPAMLARVRAAAPDRDTLARVLSRAIARAHESERPIDPSWLVLVGELELELGRFEEAIERFEEALRGDDARDDARVGLARALAARGRHEPAAAALMPVITRPSRGVPVDAKVIQLLESSLSGAGRAAEQWVARELRAVAGDLAPREQAELDARIANARTDAEGLSAASLRRFVMPGAIGRHPIWEVAAIASGIAGKLQRVALAEQGAQTRDRVKPRTNHPIRVLFDRMLRAFELTDVELAVSQHVVQPTIAVEDLPWVVVPASLDSGTEAHAVASLARPLTRIALGVPWFGAHDVHAVLAMLVAVSRQVAPNLSAGDRVEVQVADHELRARRAIDRRRKKALEDVADALDRAPPVDPAMFAEAIQATEARAAFLLSGSLRATLDAVAPSDLLEAIRVPGPPSLGAILGQPSSRDLASFALSRETTSLRRTLGTA